MNWFAEWKLSQMTFLACLAEVTFNKDDRQLFVDTIKTLLHYTIKLRWYLQSCPTHLYDVMWGFMNLNTKKVFFSFQMKANNDKKQTTSNEQKSF